MPVSLIPDLIPTYDDHLPPPTSPPLPTYLLPFWMVLASQLDSSHYHTMLHLSPPPFPPLFHASFPSFSHTVFHGEVLLIALE